MGMAGDINQQGDQQGSQGSGRAICLAFMAIDHAEIAL